MTEIKIQRKIKYIFKDKKNFLAKQKIIKIEMIKERHFRSLKHTIADNV